MSDGRKIVKRIGLFVLAFGFAVFSFSFLACFLIQEGSVRKVPEIFGLIAYLCGPLPIIPAVIGVVGVLLLGASSLMK